VLAVVGAVCLLSLVRASLTIVRHIPLNFNEGWNAYHTADVAAGRPLYPDVSGAFFTNYPPLSFYAIAPVGRALGDQMLAGRLVALLSLAAWVVLVAAVARRLRCSWISASFGALVLGVYMLVFSGFYVGVNDPQIFGQVLQLLGLVLLLGERRTRASLAASAVLLAAGVFVKTNLIALPIAAVIWLWTEDRPGAWRLMAFGALAGFAGVVACVSMFGPQFAAHVLSPRAYVPLKAALMSWQWVRRMLLPLAVAVWLARRSMGESGVRFVLTYAIVSIPVGLLFAGGEGVYWNTMFDADCALALVAALALDRASTRFVVPAAFLAVPALVLALSASIHWLSPRFWFDPRWSEAATAAADIDFVRRHDGPALCEDMSLCYWAGKPAEIDFFNVRQRSRREWWRIEQLIRRLDAHEFGVAEVQEDDRSLGPQFMDALRRNYRVDHESEWGVFWVPKIGRRSAQRSARSTQITKY
jgi:hypothetical protein